MTTTKRLLVFQHTPWERPGRFLLRAAKKHHVELSTVALWQQPPPDLTPYHGLIVLGGSPNVEQEDEHPFLRAEKEFIRRAIDKDMPYLGFCLGHQLLADALGARVGPNAYRSIGFVQGEITKTGSTHPLLRGIPRRFTLFKWHSQTVVPPPPKHVEVLVTSADCEIEAISVQGRPHLVGLQFDNHAAALADVSGWVENDRAWLSQAPGVNPRAILMGAEKLRHDLRRQFAIMFGNYLSIVAGKAQS